MARSVDPASGALAPEPAPLGLDGVAERLRLIRIVSQQRRYHGRPTPRLPSKAEIIGLLNDVEGLLYPRHFGPPGLTPDETEAHVL
ncbi:hypothetical protein LHP98_17760 [Rhodobacter sp. Har01]|uniref:hypothetical protein n=1 Tax=Rhodobacter sp. Har01 TaxID=2883999 RepID=UPI001D064D80|nr:hypothetical protein [Rhodobacter sp. Har01]MCB6179969.1 hypothetical protein [Rhodobacter sp. Har01]